MFKFPVVVYELLLLISLVVSQMTTSLFTNFENSKQRLMNAMRPPIVRAYEVEPWSTKPYQGISRLVDRTKKNCSNSFRNILICNITGAINFFHANTTPFFFFLIWSEISTSRATIRALTCIPDACFSSWITSYA